MKRKKIKTQAPEIIAYWREHAERAGLRIGPSWSEAGIRCWRCSDACDAERAHIIPHALGGADEPRNLVLLCHLCHLEGPNVDDPQLMLQWISATRVEPDDPEHNRMAVAYRALYGCAPYAGFSAVPGMLERLKAIAQALVQRAVGHDGRLNATTMAWIARQAELQLLEDLRREDGSIDISGSHRSLG